MKVYVCGSLENPRVPDIAAILRNHGFDAFDDWYSAGPEADKCWSAHQKAKGLSYLKALAGPAAQNILAFDKRHLDESDACVMVMKAGKSACLELGYMVGRGKPGVVLMEDEPEGKWDVMLGLADAVVSSVGEVIDILDYFSIQL